jgi:hypothetical protein
MKKIFILLLSLISTYNLAQVGINTENPQGVFHIDAGGDNEQTGSPLPEQQLNDVVVDNLGKMGIGTAFPTHRLHVVVDPASGLDPVNIGGLAEGDIARDYLLGITPEGVIKSMGKFDDIGIPTPALFILGDEINNFLESAGAGEKVNVPMSLIKNNIQGLTYNSSTQEIILPIGTYEFIYVYEAVHNSPGCVLGSYFVDFPGNGVTSRVNSTSPFIEGGISIHGGTISHTVRIASPTTYTINMGRGSSGNCYGSGMDLKKNSTQLLVYRIGS